MSASPPSHVLYPDRYVWYVFVSAMDIMVTVMVLIHLRMQEANTFAQWSIDHFGTWGLIGLKFLSIEPGALGFSDLRNWWMAKGEVAQFVSYQEQNRSTIGAINTL